MNETNCPDRPSASPSASRRWFLQQCGVGLGGLAFHAMMGRDASATNNDPMQPRMPHHKPRAKRVVQLFMAGGASHVDLFDFKPELVKQHGSEKQAVEKQLFNGRTDEPAAILGSVYRVGTWNVRAGGGAFAGAG